MNRFRERIFKWIFIAGDKYILFRSWLAGLCRITFIITFLIFIVYFLFFIGFDYSDKVSQTLASSFRVILLILFLARYIPEFLFLKRQKSISLIFKSLVFVLSLVVIKVNFADNDLQGFLNKIFSGNIAVISSIVLLVISETTGVFTLLSHIKIHPSLIFSLSFLIIIIAGSGLLLLPKATASGITYIDALFTSVSAVCVTGLTVVDTATVYTTLGKIIILCLIQIGGLGIMTFTGFFGYVFTSSGSSFRDRLLLKELFSTESLNNLFKLLSQIILLTLLTEIAGAVFIYFSLSPQTEKRLAVAIFHSISAFCNAGFSILPDGLFNPLARNNNLFLITVALLIILGGLGFPVLVSFYSWLKHSIQTILGKVVRNSVPVRPGVKNIATRIVVVTTIILIFSGASLYYIFESHKSLDGLSQSQKIIASFFGSISSRTAGFNIVDLNLWSMPTVFLFIFLMWIGASPGSTGGGIKTTTFALAFRSVWSNLRGRKYMVLGNREISNNTIIKVLSIIFLSVTVIAAGFLVIMIAEPAKDPVSLMFECVSAFSTTGLSISDTAGFSYIGKSVLMLLMFIGRVGPFTLLSGLLFSSRDKLFRYPDQDIVIN